MSKIIDRFVDEYSFLSNYHISENGYCVEIHYQASKFVDDDIRLKILSMKPGQSKRFAHLPENKSKIRKDWKKVSLQKMEEYLRIKYSNGPERTWLKETGDAILIEGNNWHDNFYGSCICEKCVNEKKENHLGKLIMKIRSEI